VARREICKASAAAAAAVTGLCWACDVNGTDQLDVQDKAVVSVTHGGLLSSSGSSHRVVLGT
jgi:hypothetical protein